MSALELPEDDACEAVTGHVVLEGAEEDEHIVSFCGKPAIGAYDDDGDDVILCAAHWPDAKPA